MTMILNYDSNDRMLTMNAITCWGRRNKIIIHIIYQGSRGFRRSPGKAPETPPWVKKILFKQNKLHFIFINSLIIKYEKQI